ncbi:O-antigen ligase family protein [uncultured Maricaulis sp.]|uniref:O-antigen ligase family protein n=1 Tax=uncultured Maricaulis sp. TaxID=174710 RepID=UPI002616DE32|nr:O-antigen ligase family protein [uncultured Maricaulis sp.]
MSLAASHDPAFLAVWRQAPAFRFTGVIEGGLTLLCLFLFSQGLIGPLFADPADPDSSVVLRLIWLPVYAITLALAVTRPGAMMRILTGNWLLLALVLLTAVSVIWSIAPDTTLRRSFALVMTTLFGFWMAARWSWRALIQLTAATFIGLAILSTLMAIGMPSLGVDHEVHAGAWKGVWWEKNTLGAMMAWGAVACFAALHMDPRRRWIWMGGALLCCALVLLSTSKTALLALLLGTGGAIGIALCRRGFGFASLMLFLGLSGGVAGALILLIAPVEFLELLGRDATLTGRTDIWGILSRQVGEVPWTGYGYMAFWADETGPVYWVRQGTDWPVPTAHNGWIETALAIGIPGVMMMALVFGRALIRALSRLFAGPETYWTLTFLAMLGLVSISESNLLQQNAIGWVLLVATAAKLADRRAK